MCTFLYQTHAGKPSVDLSATCRKQWIGCGVKYHTERIMRYPLIFILLSTVMNTQIIFDFNKNSSIRGWRIVDDVVMGGRSFGTFKIGPDGHGLFEGMISLENNGGFSSVRFQTERLQVADDSKVVLTIKGDGKNYQLRVKDERGKYYSYIAPFSTSGEWQDIEIPLSEMYPSFRGRKLDLPNFSSNHIEEVVFLIGNKKAERFKLLIDKIALN
jgi:NADH dehydrogenase [ubiquinone] 1 alpha subcomplex assembly factor 1